MKRLDPKLALDPSAPGPCRVACRVLADAYRARKYRLWVTDAMGRFEDLYAVLNDAEKARVHRFQERIERLRDWS